MSIKSLFILPTWVFAIGCIIPWAATIYELIMGCQLSDTVFFYSTVHFGSLTLPPFIVAYLILVVITVFSYWHDKSGKVVYVDQWEQENLDK